MQVTCKDELWRYCMQFTCKDELWRYCMQVTSGTGDDLQRRAVESH